MKRFNIRYLVCNKYVGLSSLYGNDSYTNLCIYGSYHMVHQQRLEVIVIKEIYIGNTKDVSSRRSCIKSLIGCLEVAGYMTGSYPNIHNGCSSEARMYSERVTEGVLFVKIRGHRKRYKYIPRSVTQVEVSGDSKLQSFVSNIRDVGWVGCEASKTLFTNHCMDMNHLVMQD